MNNENTLFKAMELFEISCYRNRLDSREVGLFYALLHLWNRASRPATFGAYFNQVSPLSGLGSEKTVQSARDKLIKKGVIFYEKTGNRGEPFYSFNALFSENNPLLGKFTSKVPSKRQVSGELMESKRQVSGDSPEGKEKRSKEKVMSDSEESNESLDSFLNQIWKLFPTKSRNRSTKKDLKKAWQSLKPKPDRELMLTNIKAWSETPEWNELDGQYISAVHRWVKSEKWRDAPELESQKVESPKTKIGAVQVGGRKGYIHSASDLKISIQSNEDEKNMF